MPDQDQRLRGSVQGVENRPDALLVGGSGVVKRKLGSGHGMAACLECLRDAIPAGRVVPGTVQQRESSHLAWSNRREARTPAPVPLL
jgi:hypothetical protein